MGTHDRARLRRVVRFRHRLVTDMSARGRRRAPVGGGGGDNKGIPPKKKSFVAGARTRTHRAGSRSRRPTRKKSTNSLTDAFVTLTPSLKWSSTFPLNVPAWSSGTHAPFSAASPSLGRPTRRRTAPRNPPPGGQLTHRVRLAGVRARCKNSRSLRTSRPATLRMGTKIRTVGRANPWSRGRSSDTFTRAGFRAFEPPFEPPSDPPSSSHLRGPSDPPSNHLRGPPPPPSSPIASRSLRSTSRFASLAASSALRASRAPRCFWWTRRRVRNTCLAT